jgi:hypothetical protein
MDLPELSWKILGLDENEAESLIINNGFIFRVVARDGKSFLVTQDIRRNRVNVHILGSKVSFVEGIF